MEDGQLPACHLPTPPFCKTDIIIMMTENCKNAYATMLLVIKHLDFQTTAVTEAWQVSTGISILMTNLLELRLQDLTEAGRGGKVK